MFAAELAEVMCALTQLSSSHGRISRRAGNVKLKVISKTSFSTFLLYSAALSTLAIADSNPIVWIAPSLHRVGMSDAAGAITRVNLAAARNEYESFQIVVNGVSRGL